MSHDQLDNLERDRDKRDAQRRLRIFRELLLSTFGSLDAAFEQLKASKLAGDTGELTATQWNELLEEKVKIQATESIELFDHLDGMHFGQGDGKVELMRVKQQLSLAELPNLSEEEEMQDPIGAAFAAFVNGTSVLENISFRYCDLGRIEGRQIGEAMKANQHLRTLNLYGNRICDGGVELIAEALEQHYALHYLGLGKNRVTHEGLRLICKGLGATRID